MEVWGVRGRRRSMSLLSISVAHMQMPVNAHVLQSSAPMVNQDAPHYSAHAVVFGAVSV